MPFLSSPRQQSKYLKSEDSALCSQQQRSRLRTAHTKVAAQARNPERSSVYRMKNVSLFRNHLSASKYGYKKASPTCPPLPSLPPPPCLSSLPFLSTKVSLFWSSRCVFRCIFQGRSFLFGCNPEGKSLFFSVSAPARYVVSFPSPEGGTLVLAHTSTWSSGRVPPARRLWSNRPGGERAGKPKCAFLFSRHLYLGMYALYACISHV